MATGGGEQHFFPLDSVVREKEKEEKEAGGGAAPAEGGIMMLSDLQERRSGEIWGDMRRRAAS